MATVNYSINTNTGDDWTGSFTVASLSNLVFSEAGTPTSVSAEARSFVPNNISYYDPGYITWRSANNQAQHPGSGRSFDIWSLDLYDDVVNGFTWSQLISTGTYLLTSNKNTVFYDYDIPTAFYWGVGGSITFS